MFLIKDYIPTQENYEDFLREFVNGLENIDGITLMIYGSFLRGDHDEGRSDIDALLALHDNVVTDKLKLEKIARIFDCAQEGNDVKFQVTVADRATLADGRFNSYDSTFLEYFKRESKVLVGDGLLESMVFMKERSGELHNMAYNLRKARQGLLLFEYLKRWDEKYDELRLPAKFENSMDAVTRGSKQMLHLTDGKARGYRFQTEELRTRFPDVNLDPLEELHSLYRDVPALRAVFNQPAEMLRLWQEGLTMWECLIKDYMRMNKNDE
jgi:predicted nucleotidyltransferase